VTNAICSSEGIFVFLTRFILRRPPVTASALPLLRRVVLLQPVLTSGIFSVHQFLLGSPTALFSLLSCFITMLKRGFEMFCAPTGGGTRSRASRLPDPPTVRIADKAPAYKELFASRDIGSLFFSPSSRTRICYCSLENRHPLALGVTPLPCYVKLFAVLLPLSILFPLST
jgi:hypothetical protein